MPWIPSDPASSTIPAKVGAKVRLSSAQSIPTGTPTALQFASEDWDTDGFHDNATNNTRVTVPSGLAGTYSVIGEIRYQAISSTSEREARIHKNGTLVGHTRLRLTNGTVGPTVVQVVAELELAVGDYVELVASQDSGSSLNAETIGSGSHLTVRLVAI